MDIFTRLSAEYTERHPSDVSASIAAAEKFADTRNLPPAECAAAVIIHAAMGLTYSIHDKQGFKCALQALLHPFGKVAPE